MVGFNPLGYGPVFASLLVGDRRCPLNVGRPNPGAFSLLKNLSVHSAFAHRHAEPGHVVNPGMAACCIAGVWLLHNYLNESHAISQEIETASGSFWHAILHRREGDFWNAKYWFRRVGEHPAFDALGQRAAELAAVRGEQRIIKKLITSGTWDPFAFVDLCEAVVAGSIGTHDLCLDIQRTEWEVLFEHCYRMAVDKRRAR